MNITEIAKESVLHWNKQREGNRKPMRVLSINTNTRQPEIHEVNPFRWAPAPKLDYEFIQRDFSIL